MIGKSNAGRTGLPMAPSTAEVASGVLLLSLIQHRTDEPVTRASFASSCGISQATAVRAVERLIAAGLVREGRALPRAGRGRPERPLEIDRSHYVVGISILDEPEPIVPGTPHYSRAAKLRCVPVRLDGTYDQSPEEWSTFARTEPAELINAIAAGIESIKLKMAGEPPSGIGVMLGGHTTDTAIKYSPNIGGHTDIPLSQLLRQRLGLTDEVRIVVDNDANALARRRYWSGHATEPYSFAYIVVKYDGIGCGILRDGRIHKGVLGVAGELGHLPVLPFDEELRCRCGNVGCLEQVATLVAVARRLGLAGAQSTIVQSLFERLAKRDATVREALECAGRYLGLALATMMNLVDPGPMTVALPEELLALTWFTDIVQDEAEAHVYASARAGLVIKFESLPDADETAAAAASRVVEQIADEYLRGAD